ncbi:MAG TPA: DUF4349 domain-containing protein [Candidatus Korarchaeota archaeon]|nr:DUF4349 domain-containing protein [Candidatus Korarchaeota archaeon]
MNLKKIGLALLAVLALGVTGFLYILMTQVPAGQYYEWEGREAPMMPAPMPVLPRIGVTQKAAYAEQGAEERIIQYAQTQGRAMAYEAEITIEVGEGTVQEKAKAVMGIATSLGGYVASSWIERRSAVISIKVPANKLDAAMNAVRSLGEVKSENLNAYDVTDQIIDLEARLNNSRAAERRLLEILSMAQNVEEVLMVEDRLKQVREEIEVLEAQLENLQSKVEYSTLTVTIQEKKGVELPEFDLSRLINLALTALYVAISFIVVGAFFAAPLGAVGWLGLWIYRRRKESRS